MAPSSERRSRLAAQRHDVDRWIAEQTELPQRKTGKPAAAATV